MIKPEVALFNVQSREMPKAAFATSARLPLTPRAAERLESIDFVKGALVLLMVVYHWLNYFIGLEWGGYTYLRFLTPSFIFITGVLTSQVYLRRYSPTDRQLRRRLWTRGVKLMALFIGLNVLAELTIGGRLHLTTWDRSTSLIVAKAIFVRGIALPAFDILVSIAYFLLLCPAVLSIATRLKVPLMAVSAVLVVAVAVAGLAGRTNVHVEMLSFGFLGVAVGTVPLDRLHGSIRSRRAALIAAYLIYVAAITAFGAIYPLQVPGVCLSVLLIYMFSDMRGTHGTIDQSVVRMGQYSLLAYIAQIAVLQLLRRGVGPMDTSGVTLSLLLGIAVAATMASVELAVVLRRHSVVCDRLYRLVLA
jgi:peptidoglycan/LPS O-acetylase OafA/YrhL